MKKIIEKIFWRKKTDQGKTSDRFISGFIVSENNRNLKIASTIGPRGYLDVINIPRSSILSRVKMK